MSCNGSTAGSYCNTWCNDGYDLVGNVKRLCEPTQTWSGTSPTCMRKELKCHIYITDAYMIYLSVILKSKRQSINIITFYLRVISTLVVGVVFKHIDHINITDIGLALTEMSLKQIYLSYLMLIVYLLFRVINSGT